MGVRIVLHEEVVLVGDSEVLEGAGEVAALEFRVEGEVVGGFGYLGLVGFEQRVVCSVVRAEVRESDLAI